MKRRTRSLPLDGRGGAEGSTILEGVLEHIVYVNAESAWTVARLSVENRRDLVTVVGNMPAVQVGESLRLSGAWVTDRRYGKQFRVESYITISPATLVGIEKYLGSGLVPGMGKMMARRVVRHFGLATLDVIDHAAERLTEVEGIGPVRTDRIRKAWVEQREIKEVMVFLQSHEVSTAYGVKIYKAYGRAAVAIVTENPYRLAVDIFGIGFKTADRIAASLGIEPTSPRRAEAGVLHVLGERSNDGHVYYPRGRLLDETATMLGVERAAVETALDAVVREERAIVETTADSEEDRPVYLTPLHRAEKGLAERLMALLLAPAKPVKIDSADAVEWFETSAKIALSPEQSAAVRAGLESKVVVITGGPGTGKTTVVNALTRILAHKGLTVQLTAPTGRAAKRINEATGREAKTIHRLLEFSRATMGFAHDQHNPLDADVLVVDEVSMVDTVLAYSLVKALPARCRLVLVGDVDQLPSVGCGSVLRDLISSRATAVVCLRQIFRQAAESLIVVNAHRVNSGEMPMQPAAGEAGDFFIVERREPEEILATLKMLVSERIPARFGLDPIDDVQVLTPMNRGVLGTVNLNSELQGLLNPREAAVTRGGRTFRLGDKVMQIRNNYKLDVFNGDIGRVASIDEEDRRVMVRYDDRMVNYDYADLDQIVLAYACSIHKSQGSEYPAVVIPLHTQHYVLLQRNLLYTAITRGKRLVVLAGTKKAIAIAVKNNRVAARFTRLSTRLATPG